MDPVTPAEKVRRQIDAAIARGEGIALVMAEALAEYSEKEAVDIVSELLIDLVRLNPKLGILPGDANAICYLVMSVPAGSEIKQDGLLHLVVSFNPDALQHILTSLMGYAGLHEVALEDDRQTRSTVVDVIAGAEEEVRVCAYWYGDPPTQVAAALPNIRVGESSRNDGGIALICYSDKVQVDGEWSTLSVPMDRARTVGIVLHIMRALKFRCVQVEPSESGHVLKAWKTKKRFDPWNWADTSSFLRKVWGGLKS